MKNVFAIILFLFPAQSFSQDFDYTVEIFGGAAWTRMGGDEGSLGSGPGVLGGAGIRVLPRIALEFDTLRFRHERSFTSGVRFEGTATALSGNVVFHFSDSSVQPFLMGGIGLLQSCRTSFFPFLDGTSEVVSDDDRTMTWNVGGGIKAFLSRKWSIRPQLRFYHSEVTGVLGLIAGSAAVSYHW